MSSSSESLAKGVLLIYTLPGLEDFLEKECKIKGFSVICVSPLRLRGRVAVKQVDASKVAELRTCENCVKILGVKKIEKVSARDIRLAVRELLREASSEASDLAIRAAVYGKCFSQLFLKKILAREVKRVFGKSPPRESRELLRCEVYCREKIVLLGVQLFASPLHVRDYFSRVHPAPLNPLIAAAIALDLKEKKVRRVLDPMCGCGTIPIELAMICRCDAHGIDIVPKFVKAAAASAKRAGVYEYCDFLCADFAKTTLKQAYDAVVTDPPRGIRLRANIRKIFSELYSTASSLLEENGTLCLITPHRKLALSLLHEFELEKDILVVQGDLRLHLMFMRKKAQ